MMRKIVLFAALAAATVAPHAVVAQGGPGFLFGRPKVALGFRAGYVVPRISGQIFDDARRDYNLNRFDFATPYLGGEIAVRVSERWDVALNAGWGGSETRSHYRDWVDADGFEIEQDTRFQQVTTTLGARYYFADRGRRIGRFAWVPSTLTPFIGAGAGFAWYELEQAGAFIDFGSPDLEIVGDVVQTSGTGLAGFLSLGADLSLGKQFYLTGEVRSVLAGADAGGQYYLYDGVDLSGLQFITGISLRW
ncbi:MAG TPA: hypothetical protein VFQ22_09550 [Longimicrobiales bacterium]|nr:hypothetical protein [Longimicrobiales bacterium]